MRVLHTSDWHLGRSLYGKKRYAEFEAFLNWLSNLIATERVDVLLVAGDIFDTSTPSNRAQELYYRFLCKVTTICQHIIIIGGNHDSPSFINAPQQLLKTLHIHVQGEADENPADEVILLDDAANTPLAIICAVPYLRDKDLRKAEAGESQEDKNSKMIAGLAEHYATVADTARKLQQTAGKIPIIGMGHLFTAGGKTIQDDGVRELYVGSLAHINTEVFPDCFDYLALGHLHVAQNAGNVDRFRYSGSPLPIGFGEAEQDKKVLIIDFEENNLLITEHIVPRFQRLKQIKGDLEFITSQINNLKEIKSPAWLEIIYNGDSRALNLRQTIEDAVADTELEVLSIKNELVISQILSSPQLHETLDDLDKDDVFTRCLEVNNISEEHRQQLWQCYKTILQNMQEEDGNRE
ncbi:MAG: exonuclease SbcCD subunit D C-terminal domain-containing protein [Candidatus Cloacimonetes bacterium]|nr:exonuclease SbcCD subunit D C-terminal domain-containing protein [Candidatus Cloacimonadota bacterium]